MGHQKHHCAGAVPIQMLQQIAEDFPDEAEHVKAMIKQQAAFHVLPGVRKAEATKRVDPRPGQPDREINDSNHTEKWGVKARYEGDPVCGIAEVDFVYDLEAEYLQFIKDKVGWNSYDNKGADPITTVNYKMANAYVAQENGGYRCYLGDGDGFFNNFAYCDDVIGHERGHVIIGNTSKWPYFWMFGELNEHFADVFGFCFRLSRNKIALKDSDCLLGPGSISEKLAGAGYRAIRDMRNPGTAYPNDPQPNNFDDVYFGPEDNGGVHINSGPWNRLFIEYCDRTTDHPSDDALLVWVDALKHSSKYTDRNKFGTLLINAVANVHPNDADKANAMIAAQKTVKLLK